MTIMNIKNRTNITVDYNNSNRSFHLDLDLQRPIHSCELKMSNQNIK